MSEGRIKVWNDNVYAYEEKFKGDMIRIEPKTYVEMDYDEAILFKGTFAPIKRRGDGTFDPRSFKKIRLDEEDVRSVKTARLHFMDEDKEKVYVCHACSKEFLTKTGLEKHIKQKHMSDMVDKEAMKEMHDREDLD
jgi:hypothetical protein